MTNQGMTMAENFHEAQPCIVYESLNVLQAAASCMTNQGLTMTMFHEAQACILYESLNVLQTEVSSMTNQGMTVTDVFS